MGAAIWDIIREATRTSHSRLDVALSRLDIAIPLYYEAFLRSQAEALFPLEAALETGGIENLIPDWTLRVRTPSGGIHFYLKAPVVGSSVEEMR